MSKGMVSEDPAHTNTKRGLCFFEWGKVGTLFIV
jgi:hypothetical protein